MLVPVYGSLQLDCGDVAIAAALSFSYHAVALIVLIQREDPPWVLKSQLLPDGNLQKSHKIKVPYYLNPAFITRNWFIIRVEEVDQLHMVIPTLITLHVLNLRPSQQEFMHVRLF